MKKQLLVLLCFLTIGSITAQVKLSKDYSYSISKPYKVFDAAKKFYFSENDEILSVKPGKKLIIQKFNVKSLKQISVKEYEDLPDNYVVEGMVEVQNKYYFFYSSWSGRKTKHERLYYRKIDFKKGIFIGKEKKLIDISGKLAGSPMASYARGNFGYGFSFGSADKFDFLKSKDESKLLIQYRKKPKVKSDKKSHDIIGVSVFDVALNSIWKKEYRMPYTERRMDALDFAVDAEGKGYMLAKVFHDDSNKDKKRRKDKTANYHMELFRMLNGSDKILKTKIELGEKFINGISLFENVTGELVCAGFYNKGIHGKTGSLLGKEFKANSADGLFVCNVSKEGVVEDIKTYEIPLEVLNQYVSNKTKKKNAKKEGKGKSEFEYLKLHELLFTKDGSLVLIGEQNFMKRHTTSKGRVYYTYHYNDILISKINTAGNLAWMKKIPKRQKGRAGKGGMSYSHFFTSGNHYLIYLDNVKNIDLPLNKIPALHSDGHGGYLTSYKINDETGVVSRGSVLDTRNVKDKMTVYQYSNNRVIKTTENEFVVEFYKKKKEDVLIKVKIKEEDKELQSKL